MLTHNTKKQSSLVLGARQTARITGRREAKSLIQSNFGTGLLSAVIFGAVSAFIGSIVNQNIKSKECNARSIKPRNQTTRRNIKN
jgi:hypothetical protein